MKTGKLFAACAMFVAISLAGMAQTPVVPTPVPSPPSTSRPPSPPPQPRPAAPDTSEESMLTVWPGQSVQWKTITATWKVNPNPDEAAGESSETLVLQGKDDTVSASLVPRRDLNFVLDDTLITAGPENSRATLAFKPVNSRPHFTGRSEDLMLFVSAVNPAEIEQYRIELSSNPVSYPDGSKYHELIVTDKTSGEVVRFPADRLGSRRTWSMRTFGRFTLKTQMLNGAAAGVGVNASPDYSLRGGDTLTTQIAVTGVNTMGELFDALGKQYGFQVEWTAPEDQTSTMTGEHAIRAMRELPLSGDPRSKPTREGLYLVSEWIAKELKDYNARFLKTDWVTPRHLKLTVPEIAQVLRDEEERKQTVAEYEQMLAKVKAQQSVKAYGLKRLSAETARSIVNPELKKYRLAPQSERTEATGGHEGGIIIESGPKYWDVVAYASDKSFATQWHLLSTDTAEGDSRANALFVTAMPQTHKRITELLDKMDAMLGAEETTATGKRYRIEIVLLQGAAGSQSAGAAPVKPSGQAPPADSSSLLPDDDPKVFTLRQLESQLTDAQVRYKHAKAELDRIKGEVAAGKAPPAKAEEATLQTEMASGALQSTTLGVEQAKLVLRTKSSQLKSADEYGISKEDQKLFGFEKVTELGRGLVSLVPEPGEAGQARTLLTDTYSVDLEYKDVRRPYVIVRTKLIGGTPEKNLLENTVFLEKDKPSVLGLTNLKEVIVLISILRDAP